MKKPPQIDDYVSPRPLRYIGALREFAGRARFYLGYPQFLMISILFYYESTLIQSIIPTVWHWAGLLVTCGLFAMALEYGVVYPSQITFNRGQGEQTNRSPMFKTVTENSQQLDDIQEQLNNRRTAVADGGCSCPNCDCEVEA